MNPNYDPDRENGEHDRDNYGPNDRPAPPTQNHEEYPPYSGSDLPEDNNNGSQSARPDSNRYRVLKERYQGASLRETKIQLVGLVFVAITLILELSIYFWMDQLADRNLPPKYFLEHSSIFVLLFIITILASLQMVIIARWNKHVREGKLSITRSQYMVVERINIIRLIIVVSLILLAVFLLLVRREYIAFDIFMERPSLRFPERFLQSSRLRSLWRWYSGFLRSAQIIALIYFAVEIRQIVIWTRKIRNIEALELKIREDLPEIDALVEALENSDSGSIYGSYGE